MPHIPGAVQLVLLTVWCIVISLLELLLVGSSWYMDQYQKNPSSPFSGRSQELPACLCFSKQLLSQSLAKQPHGMHERFPHSEQNEVLTSTFPAGMRNCIYHPAFPGRTKGAFCSLPLTYGFRMKKKRSCLSFPGRLTCSSTWTSAVSSRAGEALLTKWEWSIARAMLPPENFPSLEEKK